MGRAVGGVCEDEWWGEEAGGRGLWGTSFGEGEGEFLCWGDGGRKGGWMIEIYGTKAAVAQSSVMLGQTGIAATSLARLIGIFL